MSDLCSICGKPMDKTDDMPIQYGKSSIKQRAHMNCLVWAAELAKSVLVKAQEQHESASLRRREAEGGE